MGWFARAKEKKAELDFRNGFGFAMYSYFLEDIPPKELVEQAQSQVELDRFDQGIVAATHIVIAIEKARIDLRNYKTIIDEHEGTI